MLSPKTLTAPMEPTPMTMMTVPLPMLGSMPTALVVVIALVLPSAMHLMMQMIAKTTMLSRKVPVVLMASMTVLMVMMMMVSMV